MIFSNIMLLATIYFYQTDCVKHLNWEPDIFDNWLPEVGPMKRCFFAAAFVKEYLFTVLSCKWLGWSQIMPPGVHYIVQCPAYNVLRRNNALRTMLWYTLFYFTLGEPDKRHINQWIHARPVRQFIYINKLDISKSSHWSYHLYISTMRADPGLNPGNFFPRWFYFIVRSIMVSIWWYAPKIIVKFIMRFVSGMYNRVARMCWSKLLH